MSQTSTFSSEGVYFPDGLCWEQCGQFVMAIVEARLPRAIRRNLGVSDVVQSVLCQVEAKRDQFRGDTRAEFRCWIMRIAEHKIVDGIRRFRRVTESTDSHGRGQIAIATLSSSDVETPSEQIALKEQTQHLLLALAELPDQQRQIVTLRYLRGMTFEQISDELCISNTTCRRRWMQAIKRMETRLEPCFS